MIKQDSTVLSDLSTNTVMLGFNKVPEELREWSGGGNYMSFCINKFTVSATI